MTIIAALLRCCAKLACRWSPTGHDNTCLAGHDCHPNTHIMAVLDLHLDRQSHRYLLPVAQSKASTAVVLTRQHTLLLPNPHSAYAKPPPQAPAGSFFGGFQTPARASG